MEIKVFCHNCKVEILRADTDTLKSPLVGNMFQVKKDMEWALFSPHDMGFDLICPMCDWAFHEEGKVRVAVGDDFVFGVPEVIVPGIEAYLKNLPAPEEREEAPTVIDRPEKVIAVQTPILKENPALKLIQEQVEGAPVKDPVKPEGSHINKGVWSETADADEESEIEGKAPPGTEATQPAVVKKTGRPKGSKNRGAKYRNKKK